jgi:hypothetical protein
MNEDGGQRSAMTAAHQRRVERARVERLRVELPLAGR